tara:strand:+ start:412 stop:834 length:423 start_codon:yes stop_codon:yes gene_type:complete
MPSYKLPELQTQAQHDIYTMDGGTEAGSPGKWERQVSIPSSPEILAALEVGEEASVTLRGKIIESTRSDKDGGRNNFVLSITEVDAYMTQEDLEADFSLDPTRTGLSDADEMESMDLAETQMDKGFGNGRGQFGSGRSNY